MKVLKSIAEARHDLQKHRRDEESIGLVPTMGALHKGHLSLVAEAIANNDITVVSIFVNPIQFNNSSDLEQYPVSLEADLQKLAAQGVDYVFLPTNEEMYPEQPTVNLDFGHLEEVMEGQFRPGHFNGVGIVVAKLFNILLPTRAYFGQKDLQQYKIIEKLVHDFTFDLELVMLPIIREASGLAMSSRNQRLSEEGRGFAAEIYKALLWANQAIIDGREKSTVIEQARKKIAQNKAISLEYLTLAYLEDLRPFEQGTPPKQLVLCFAGHVEGVRLIDNVIVGEK